MFLLIFFWYIIILRIVFFFILSFVVVFKNISLEKDIKYLIYSFVIVCLFLFSCKFCESRKYV